ncbi:hypothetical protein Ciccas_001200 [Cichlidogyrus casuarinus]|uniref:Uncharacterized protein n=1 Tax=Cichlidogyrus casuarinus TaxID=1844966 RepID=A0ABD2QKQ8_9PLAT
MSVDQKTGEEVSCTKEELQECVEKCTNFKKSRKWACENESLGVLKVFFVYLEPERVEQIVDLYKLRLDKNHPMDIVNMDEAFYTKVVCSYKFSYEDVKINLDTFQKSQNEKKVKAYTRIIDSMLIMLVAGTVSWSQAIKLWSFALTGIEKRFSEKEKASKVIADQLLFNLKNKCEEWHEKLKSIYANWSEATVQEKYIQIPEHYYFVLYILYSFIKKRSKSCTLS